MLKKIIVRFIMLVVICLALTSCGQEETKESSSTESSDYPSTSEPASQPALSEFDQSSKEEISTPIESDLSTPRESTNQEEHTGALDNASESDIQPILVESTASTVTMEMLQSKISLKQLESVDFYAIATIYNDSDYDIVLFTEYFVEYSDGAKWVQLPFDEINQPNWASAMGPIIPSRTSFEARYVYWDFDDELLTGKYRIVQRIYSLDYTENFLIYGNFLVE